MQHNEVTVIVTNNDSSIANHFRFDPKKDKDRKHGEDEPRNCLVRAPVRFRFLARKAVQNLNKSTKAFGGGTSI